MKQEVGYVRKWRVYVNNGVLFEAQRPRPRCRGQRTSWPIHDIASTNIARCLAHKRGVGGEAYLARYCLWAKYSGGKKNEAFRANNRTD